MNYLPKIQPKRETEKITKFIKATFKKAGKTKAIIAVSGGIDSSTTLFLTVKALSAKNVLPLILPSKTTDPEHIEDVKKVIEKTKIPEKNISSNPISAIIQKTWRIIKRYSPPEALAKKGAVDRKKMNLETANLNRIRLGNIAARARMIVIFDHAKRHDALVVGTENHSEHLLGYYTRFGDEASDLEPIRHLYKTQLIELAKYLRVPKEIINKPPTAGLWKNQTDESELGFSYKQADPILYLYYEQNMSAEDIAKTLTKTTQNNYEKTLKLTNKVIDYAKSQSFKHQLPYTL
jgi:NAD+ synthase